ncbi:MAG: mechanosensitive ion channel family protein [Candidatus Pacebacteria bacterium]|nr:mechanosensitive ion channel family protein [Candidatus Paceibacterota bacterium]
MLELIENNYLRAVFIILVFFLSAKLIAFLSEKFLLTWLKRTKSQIDDLILLKTKSPLVKLLVLIGAKIGINILGLEGWILNLINSIIIVLAMYVTAVVGDIVLEAWTDRIDKKNKSNLVQSLLPIFSCIINVLFFLGGVIWVLREWAIDITPFLTSLGVAGVIVGFAMQDSLKNVFGGISLLLDGSFKVNEKIQLETGEVGIIEDVSVRSTKIKTFNNELLTIPNGRLAEMRIINYAKPNTSVRVFVNFGVAYGTDIKKLRKLVQKLIDSDETLLRDVHDLSVTNLDDSSITCQMQFWVEDYMVAFDKKVEMIERLYNELNKAKIEIPFPTRTVYVKKTKDR